MAIVRENILINEEYLKAYSPIPLNYNIEEVLNYVKLSELIWVECILGTALYEQLLDEVNENNVSDENSTLLLQIYPYEAFTVVYEALPFIWSNISEVGITLGKSDNSESISMKDLNYIKDHLRAQIEVRKKHLIHWIEERKEHFPLYRSECDCGCDEISASNCCGVHGLHSPNKRRQVWTPPRINMNIK